MARYEVTDEFDIKFEIERITATYDIFFDWFTEQQMDDRKMWDYTTDVLSLI